MLPSHKDPERTNVVCVKAGLPEIPDSESGLLSSLRRRAALQGGGQVPQPDRVSSGLVLRWEELLMGGGASLGEELCGGGALPDLERAVTWTSPSALSPCGGRLGLVNDRAGLVGV